MSHKKWNAPARKIAAIFSLAALLILPFSVIAAGQTPDKNIYLPEDQTIDDNYFIAGETVVIDGQVVDDLVVAGGNITINGDVGGDILAAGGNVTINGNAGGDIRVVGGTLNLNGTVGGNASIAGGTIFLNDNFNVAKTVSVAGGQVQAFGTIGRDLHAAGGQIILGSDVGRDADVAVDELVVQPSVVIAGNLKYESGREANIPTQAQIGGDVLYNAHQKALPNKADIEVAKGVGAGVLAALAGIVLAFKFVMFLAFLLVGLVFIVVIPKAVRGVMDIAMKQRWQSIGWGFVFLIVTPVVVGILMATIVGIPLALMVLALYMAALYVSHLIFSIVLGEWIIKYFAKNKKKTPGMFWSLLLGAVVFGLLASLPIIGWIVKLIGCVWGLGAGVLYDKEWISKLR